MELMFIRHGMTEGNRLKRYIGSTDEPLSPEGEEQLRSLRPMPERKQVYVSPMLRTRQTAVILFPGAEQIIVEEFREMDFGAFENRSADEMAGDPDYRAWVNGMCRGRCPGGEDRKAFSDRVCAAFVTRAERLKAEGAEQAALVVHGGTVMAICERFALPKKDYYEYGTANGCALYCTLAEGDGPVLVNTHAGRLP